jgi:hypothetical protein
MKKILVTTLVACALVSSALAQGTITFVSPIGSVKYTPDGTTAAVAFPAGNPAQVAGFGQLNIAAYYNTAGTAISMSGAYPNLTGWKLFSPILHQIAPLAGGVPGAVLTSGNDVAAGANIQLEIVAWTGSFADFTAAAAAGTGLLAWSGDSRSGGGLGWTQAIGSLPPGTPAAILTGASAYNGLVLAPIPEPSTFALAGLGAAALLIFRRRQ